MVDGGEEQERGQEKDYVNGKRNKRRRKREQEEDGQGVGDKIIEMREYLKCATIHGQLGTGIIFKKQRRERKSKKE